MLNYLPLNRAVGWFRRMFLLLLVIGCTAVFGQEKSISGSVSDRSTSESLPGASVLVKGTSIGSITDIDGKFILKVPSSESVLVVSYIGYEGVEIPVGSLTFFNVQLVPSKTSLQEVVVVGYGTTRVRDLTSAITTVKSEDINRTPASQPLQSLQGKVAGMQVVTGGGPGSSPTVRIRGIGSFPGRENEAPLYVVDGMFYDNIDFLNPTDIASMSVMKDASAAAIYGVRAANGVVLIETRSGAYNQKTEVVYNGYFGYQVAQNVVKMANSQQFTIMARESGSAADETFILNAMQRYGRSRVDPNIPEPNTNWYNEILRPAPMHNHSLDFSGGTEKARYSLGANYFYQDGIMNMENNYERMNLRTKMDIKATNWLTIGGNMIYSNALKNLEQNGAWNQAYFAVPIMPVYDTLNEEAYPDQYSSGETIGYRQGQNPFPTMEYNLDRMKIKKLLANFYAEIQLIPKVLTFKTTYNYSFTGIDQRIINLPWFLTNKYQNADAVITRKKSEYNNYIWDNVLTFTKSFDRHNLTVMGGTSFKDEGYQYLTAQGKNNFPVDMEESWYIAQTAVIEATAVTDDGSRQYGMSYFGRLAYNFNDKYLFYATMRADGSNKYQQTWGYFPTFGAGWVITEEKFIKKNDILNYLKIRASWGQLGNDNIQASDGAYTTTVQKTTIDGVVVPGTVVSNSYSELKWEMTEETDIGFTARFIKNKLAAEFDYYNRDTKNAAIPVQIPGVGGSVLKPVGTIRNSGFELSLDWSNEISDKLSYNVGFNMATLKNEAIDLYGQDHIDGGTAEFLQRTYIGEPLMAFYGREVAGVYQNQAEIDADPVAVENGLVPGDFKYVDQNNDGKVDDEDRVILGSYFPNFIYGGNIGIRFMNFDFNVSVYGQEGNKVLNRKRGEIIWTADGNLDADLAENRWHGEGTSDKYPSSSGLRRGWNQKMSDYFVEDGSFFRIQNIQVGYTLKNADWVKGNFPEIRVYFTAERPLTLFKYNGFTPEVANGWDDQAYPIAAIYTVGLNVKF